MDGNLKVAGIKSRYAHTCFSLGANEMESQEGRAAIREVGNAHWAEAVNNLRLHGMGLPVHDEEDQFLLDDEGNDDDADAPAEAKGFDSKSDPSPIDFKPLQRAYYVSLAVKTVNRLALAALIFSAGALYGYTPRPLSADDVQQLHQIEKQMQQNGGAK